jgi:hypothetical protein
MTMCIRTFSLVALLTVVLAATKVAVAQLPRDDSSSQVAAAKAVPVERSSRSNAGDSNSSNDPSQRGPLTYARRVRGGGIPEIDPSSMASALTLLMGGTLVITDRFRRRRGAAATV